jgi:hypothetical protein
MDEASCTDAWNSGLRLKNIGPKNTFGGKFKVVLKTDLIRYLWAENIPVLKLRYYYAASIDLDRRLLKHKMFHLLFIFKTKKLTINVWNIRVSLLGLKNTCPDKVIFWSDLFLTLGVWECTSCISTSWVRRTWMATKDVFKRSSLNIIPYSRTIYAFEKPYCKCAVPQFSHHNFYNTELKMKSFTFFLTTIKCETKLSSRHKWLISHDCDAGSC